MVPHHYLTTAGHDKQRCKDHERRPEAVCEDDHGTYDDSHMDGDFRLRPGEQTLSCWIQGVGPSPPTQFRRERSVPCCDRGTEASPARRNLRREWVTCVESCL